MSDPFGGFELRVGRPLPLRRALLSAQHQSNTTATVQRARGQKTDIDDEKNIFLLIPRGYKTLVNTLVHS